MLLPPPSQTEAEYFAMLKAEPIGLKVYSWISHVPFLLFALPIACWQRLLKWIPVILFLTFVSLGYHTCIMTDPGICAGVSPYRWHQADNFTASVPVALLFLLFLAPRDEPDLREEVDRDTSELDDLRPDLRDVTAEASEAPPPVPEQYKVWYTELPLVAQWNFAQTSLVIILTVMAVTDLFFPAMGFYLVWMGIVSAMICLVMYVGFFRPTPVPQPLVLSNGRVMWDWVALPSYGYNLLVLVFFLIVTGAAIACFLLPDTTSAPHSTWHILTAIALGLAFLAIAWAPRYRPYQLTYYHLQHVPLELDPNELP